MDGLLIALCVIALVSLEYHIDKQAKRKKSKGFNEKIMSKSKHNE